MAPSGPHGPVVPLEVSGLAATTGALAALGRVALAARRTGRRVRLCGASAALRALVELAGLGGQFEWEPEEREEPCGVEERVGPGDAAP